MSVLQNTIPWSTPWFNGLEAAGVASAFETTWLSSGPKVLEFETKMAALAGSKFASAVNNGTSALEIALQAKGIGPGDTVAVPAFTYFATISAVVRVGATPIFVDSEANSFNLCPQDLLAKLASNTKAVIYIDYAGLPANYAAIEKIARKANLIIIHDAAQSPGTTRQGKSIVSEGDISTTSFHAAKLMTTIEGGMIFCNDDQTHRKIKSLRNQGEGSGEKYVHTDFGTNARMTDIQAAIGLAQLDRLPAIVEKRQTLAKNYEKMLQGCPGLQMQQPSDFPESSLSWMLYPILIENRDAIAADLKAAGIDTRIAYARPTYRQPCVQEKYPHLKVSSPRAEYICSRILNLPMFHDMTESQQQRVSDAVKESADKYSNLSAVKKGELTEALS